VFRAHRVRPPSRPVEPELSHRLFVVYFHSRADRWCDVVRSLVCELTAAVETFSRLLQQAIGSPDAPGGGAAATAAGNDDTEMSEEEVRHTTS
jgi:hypothetical protein